MSSRPSRGAARLAAILDALPDALLLVNANGTIVNANSIALETFEAPGTALVGRGLLDLLPGFDSKRIPGSMRRPDPSEGPRTKPTRMIARRTDGTEFPVEVTSANLEDARTPYADGYAPYTGDELLMLVVRDLTGTLDTETELARQQRQTEMILRAASEGVVGVDTEGKVVLVNPAAAQILGFRASDLGGQELHPLIHHSRPDGSPLPYEETPLSDTLRSGRKHRVRGQVLWTKDGRGVPVDLTTAPVREGEALVGAVMTFTDRSRLNSLASRHAQLRAVLDASLRAPLEELRGELTTLVSDPAAQLWPEANQILHHLAAGYARMTSLIDNVLAYQRLDAGTERLDRRTVALNEVVAAGVDGAVELMGPGRAQYAVHAPPVRAVVDGARLAQAIAHLIVDVAGVDATGRTAVVSGDSTIVVAVVQRGDVVRIDVRGPAGGGSPVHLPIVRGIVERHGGVLQTHDVPGGQGGSAYVLEVPVGDVDELDEEPDDDAGQTAGADQGTGGVGTDLAGGGRDGRENDSGMTVMPMPSDPVRGTQAGAPGSHGVGPATARPPHPRRPMDETGGGQQGAGGQGGPGSALALPPGPGAAGGQDQHPTGRRRALRRMDPDGAPNASAQGGMPNASAASAQGGMPQNALPPGSMSQGSQGGVPQGGMPQGGGRPGGMPELGSGQQSPGQGPVVAGQGPGQGQGGPSQGQGQGQGQGMRPPGLPGQNQGPGPVQGQGQGPQAHAMPGPGPQSQGGPGGPSQGGGPSNGRRARRALSDGQQHELPARSSAHALPPGGQGEGRPMTAAAALPAQQQGRAALPEQATGGPDPAHRQGPRPRTEDWPDPQGWPAPQGAGQSGPYAGAPGDPRSGAQSATQGAHGAHGAHATHGGQQEQPGRPTGRPELPPAMSSNQAMAPTGGPAAMSGAEPSGRRAKRPPNGPQHPGAMPPAVDHTGHAGQGQHEAHEAEARAISVRTLGQGVAFAAQAAPETMAPPQQHQAHQPLQAQPHHPQQAGPSNGSGRRRRLAAPQTAGGGQATADNARPHPAAGSSGGHPVNPAFHPSDTHGHGQAFTIGAPAEGAEGPEMLDGPGGAIEVTGGSGAAAGAHAGVVARVGQAAVAQVEADDMDDEFSGPRRLLVWPEPDVSTRQALTDRGYRPVTVRSREEVDAQVAEYPAALFVDPLTGPITRTALQSLRAAAVAAEVPVLVTAGLGQATREAAYGADPAVLLKALAPRDSEQHPPRVLLVESHHDIAAAFTATLERRGMQVAHAASEGDAANLASQMRPNLVVMDLMLIRRRRVGIVDWLRANGLLNRTPLVVYTSVDIDAAELPRLSSGETVLFLAERSTSAEVQGRIVDLLSKIGTELQ